jgi:polysaccharide export outer membrane protein
MRTLLALTLALVALAGSAATAQPVAKKSPAAKPPAPATRPAVTPATASPDAAFIIGPDDVLGILFWRDQEMSSDTVVRPDGMITLPLIRDIKAAGLTPTQLADRIQDAAREYISDASVTVVVRQMNSRTVYITGEVAHPGGYHLTSSMTVMQLIAVSGGVTEFGRSDAVYRVEVQSGQVSRIATLPQPTAHAPLVAALGALWLVGGDGSRSILRIDPTSGRVSRAGRLPKALANAAAVKLADGRVAVLGGDGSGVVWAFEPAR